MGEIAQGVPPKGAKTCFVLLFSMQRGPLATYPALISTIFEIKDVNWFLPTFTVEKFRNFARGFPRPKNS